MKTRGRCGACSGILVKIYLKNMSDALCGVWGGRVGFMGLKERVVKLAASRVSDGSCVFWEKVTMNRSAISAMSVCAESLMARIGEVAAAASYHS